MGASKSEHTTPIFHSIIFAAKLFLELLKLTTETTWIYIYIITSGIKLHNVQYICIFKACVTALLS